MKVLSKKGIAIPYIIALILGVIVVAVIGYWILGLSGLGGGAGITVDCDAQLIIACQEWAQSGFSPTYSFTFSKYAEYEGKQCPKLPDGIEPRKDKCKQLLGLS